MEPDYEDVVQVEPEEGVIEAPVLVAVDGPVRSVALPRKAGTTFTRSIGLSTVQLLRADPRRAVAVITSFDDDLYIAFNVASAQDPSRMALWPKGTPFRCEAATEVYVQANTADTDVSVVTELWAQGE